MLNGLNVRVCVCLRACVRAGGRLKNIQAVASSFPRRLRGTTSPNPTCAAGRVCVWVCARVRVCVRACVRGVCNVCGGAVDR